jgi:hypothetical protein
VTPEEIASRNRANAGHSTGPRTAGGKAIVAQNARVHGATGQPDPGRVATWLRVILDAPDLSLPEALGVDPRMQAALALAVAEARVETAERGWREAMTLQPDGDGDWDADPVLAALRRQAGGATTEKQIQELLAVGLRHLEAQAMNPRRIEARQRLAERYLREARAQRRRAFSAWIAVLASKGHEGGPGALTAAA